MLYKIQIHSCWDTSSGNNNYDYSYKQFKSQEAKQAKPTLQLHTQINDIYTHTHTHVCVCVCMHAHTRVCVCMHAHAHTAHQPTKII